MGRRRARDWNRPERHCRICGLPIWRRSDGRQVSELCSAECRAAELRMQESKRIAEQMKERRRARARRLRQAGGTADG